MAYTGVYVFGDSLVDSGNALKLAKFYGDLTFGDMPDGTPSAELGYYDGRFSNGFTFADLLANKAVGQVSHPTFPFGYVDPWTGTEIAPWTSDPNGVSLNFAYGGAQVRGGDEAGLDLDHQTDAFKDAVDGDAPSGALYIVTMGGNDVRNLAKVTSDPADQLGGYAVLDKVVDQMIGEIGQLITSGARNILITGIPDVGLIPDYDIDNNNLLDASEQARANAATDFSQYLDLMIRTEVVPAMEARGATITYVPMMDYQAGGVTVTGGLNAILPTMEALHDLAPGTLSNDLLAHRSLVFFDDIHPTAQVHALFGSYAQALLAGTQWVETLPLTGPDVDYGLTASIAVGGEVDKLVIALVAGTDYRFDMLGMSSLGVAGTLADPQLRLLGPSGSVAGANADDGAGFDASLAFRAAGSGNYTLELSAIGSITGGYVLQASVIGGAAMLTGNSYNVGSATTLVLEGAGGIGLDVVKASVSFVLATGSEIELLTTANPKGKTAINLTGNEFAQQITGNAGANVIDGKGGADTLTGGAGKDVFVLGGGAVDWITDYGSGDIVDISQLLNVAAGVNVVSGGYVRVTTGGLLQVDANGGGDQWTTLSQINSGGAVTVRFGSGGSVANVTVGRVAVSNTMLAANMAAAGLLAGPAIGDGAQFAGDGFTSSVTAAMAGGALEATVMIGGEAGRGALLGETRETALTLAEIELSGLRPTLDHRELGIGGEAMPASPIGMLAHGTELPAMSMPDFSAPIMPAAPGGEIGQILSDALGGDGGAPSIADLLDALPGHGAAAIQSLSGVDAVGAALAFVPPIGMAGLEMVAMHQDALASV